MYSIRLLCSFIPPPTLSPSVSSLLARHTRFRHEFIWQTVCRLCLFTAGSGAASERAPVFAFVIVISLLFSHSLSALLPLSPLRLGGRWREERGSLVCPVWARQEPPPPGYSPQAPPLQAHPIPLPRPRGAPAPAPALSPPVSLNIHRRELPKAGESPDTLPSSSEPPLCEADPTLNSFKSRLDSV